MTLCLARWLASEELFCQLEAGHAGEHSSKYRYSIEKETIGEISWWNDQQNVISERNPSAVARSVAIVQEEISSALIAAKTSTPTSSTKKSNAEKSARASRKQTYSG